MSEYTNQQREYFNHIDHVTRFRWQTEDAFVTQHEQETIRPLLDLLRCLTEHRTEPIRVFESGCGEGVNATYLRQCGFGPEQIAYQGIDISERAIQEARQHGLNVIVRNGLALPYESGSFDLVFCRDVLHHLGNDAERQQFFSEMKRVTRQGGFVVAIEPNAKNLCILGLSILVPAERGLRSVSEGRIKRLLPGTQALRRAPSALWRFLYHYRSPLRSNYVLAAITRLVLRMWEWICHFFLPSYFWSYRIYIWNI